MRKLLFFLLTVYTSLCSSLSWKYSFQSSEGRPMRVARIGLDTSPKPAVFIDGGMHARWGYNKKRFFHKQRRLFKFSLLENGWARPRSPICCTRWWKHVTWTPCSPNMTCSSFLSQIQMGKWKLSDRNSQTFYTSNFFYQIFVVLSSWKKNKEKKTALFGVAGIVSDLHTIPPPSANTATLATSFSPFFKFYFPLCGRWRLQSQ
jgi:hypothetical protein